MNQIETNTIRAESPEPQDILREVEVSKITVNRFQPRRNFEWSDLEELALSIKTVGIIHPPVVRPLDGSTDSYELISGERRLRASQLAGLTKIPVVIRHSTNTHSAQAALIENLQRVDLNPLDIAHAFQQLMQEFGFNQEELSLRVGKKRSTVSNYLRLLTLPKSIQESITNGFITMGHAKVILSLDTKERQELLHELILRDDLTVRATEEAAAKIVEKVKKQTVVYVNRDFYLEQLEEKLQHKLGTKVFIQGTGKKGRIQIDYYNLDDLDRLLKVLGIDS